MEKGKDRGRERERLDGWGERGSVCVETELMGRHSERETQRDEEVCVMCVCTDSRAFVPFAQLCSRK